MIQEKGTLIYIHTKWVSCHTSGYNLGGRKADILSYEVDNLGGRNADILSYKVNNLGRRNCDIY